MKGGPPSFQRAPLGGAGGGVPPTMMQYGNPAAAGFPSQQGSGVMGAGAAMGMGMGMGMGMRPAGVGVPAGPTVGGNVIPDVSTLGAKTAKAQGHGQGQQAEAQKAHKAPDSFSFVMDAMQDSIK